MYVCITVWKIVLSIGVFFIFFKLTVFFSMKCQSYTYRHYELLIFICVYTFQRFFACWCNQKQIFYSFFFREFQWREWKTDVCIYLETICVYTHNKENIATNRYFVNKINKKKIKILRTRWRVGLYSDLN